METDLTNRSGNNNLQALTVGISNKGLNSFFNYVTQGLMTQSFSAPDQHNMGGGKIIPMGSGQSMTLYGVSVSKGLVKDVAISAPPDVQQNADGSLTVVAQGSFSIAYGIWRERGFFTYTNRWGDYHENPFDNTYENQFSFTISSITLTFSVKLTDSGQWSVSITNAKQSNISLGQLNIPSESVLKDPSSYHVVNSKIHDALVDAIKGENYAADLAKALNNALGTIPNSGSLTPSIVYQFYPSSAPAYPAGGGIAVGISGQVLYKAQPYAGAQVFISVPTIDTARDVSMNISTYELNALLWACYMNGDLHITATPANTGKAAILNTKYYKTLVPGLYLFAPDSELDMVINATEAPLISVGPVYCITQNIYNTLKSTLDEDAYAKLKGCVGWVYVTEDGFNKMLSNLLTPDEYSKYFSKLDTAAVSNGVIVATGFFVTVNVIKQGQSTLAFSFRVKRTDSLSRFQLATNPQSGKSTLNFLFSEASSNTTLEKRADEMIIDQKGLDIFWSIFDGLVDICLAKIGNDGIAVPNIDGFYLSNPDPNVSIAADQGGYVSVATNISHS